jgi:hypothetical protein
MFYYLAQYPCIYSEWIEWSILITFLVGNRISSEIGVRIWLIMDISFISDGWSYSRNPGRIPGRSGQWFPAAASATSKSG